MSDRIWAATPGVGDCHLDASGTGPPCDMCGEPTVGLHIHIETTGPSGLRRILGFCSEECAGRWVAGEKVTADRDMVAALARLVGGS